MPCVGVGDADRDGDGEGDRDGDGEADADRDGDFGDEGFPDAEAEARPVEEPGLTVPSSAVSEGVGWPLAGEA
jgi:hypothetical protein